MGHTNVLMQASQLLEHRAIVIQAAQSYHNLSWITITSLANSFNVSENIITEWLCEAISNRYIVSDLICSRIMEKHVAEYEQKHNIPNSSLRVKYQEAFTMRSNGTQSIDINSLLHTIQNKARH